MTMRCAWREALALAPDLQLCWRRMEAKTFDFAETEAEAIEAARARRPNSITFDVALLEGTGPKAVETIVREMGSVPVIFTTGTPEACHSCPPPARVLEKSLHYPAITSALQEWRHFADKRRLLLIRA